MAVLVLSSAAFAIQYPVWWPAPLPPIQRYEFQIQIPEAQKETGRYAELAKVITDEERALSALTIYHEARGQSYEGQKAVCEVIFNRWLSPKWQDTVKEIIYAPGQFSVASYLLTANINEPECLAQAFDIVDEVLEETEYILPSEDYVYFATSVIGKEPKKLGNHYFCK